MFKSSSNQIPIDKFSESIKTYHAIENTVPQPTINISAEQWGDIHLITIHRDLSSLSTGELFLYNEICIGELIPTEPFFVDDEQIDTLERSLIELKEGVFDEVRGVRDGERIIIYKK